MFGGKNGENLESLLVKQIVSKLLKKNNQLYCYFIMLSKKYLLFLV